MNVWRAAAFVWGLAEATFFFLVPDVLLSVLVQRRGLPPALDGACCAVAGACLGGLFMWQVGQRDPAGVRAFLDGVPAISAGMIAEAEAALRVDFAGTLFAGAFSGVPYKVFAALAAGAGIGWPELVLLSVPARFCRFALVVLIVAGVDRVAAIWLGARGRTALLLAGWTAFYAAFWSLVGA